MLSLAIRNVDVVPDREGVHASSSRVEVRVDSVVLDERHQRVERGCLWVAGVHVPDQHVVLVPPADHREVIDLKQSDQHSLNHSFTGGATELVWELTCPMLFLYAMKSGMRTWRSPLFER